MSVCLLNHAGEILVHRAMKASPETFLQVIASYREAIVVAVECLCTWDRARRPVGPRRIAFCPRPCPV
jgi:hypothetical protein